MTDDIIMKRVLQVPGVTSVLDRLDDADRDKIIAQIKTLSVQLEEMAAALLVTAQNPDASKALREEMRRRKLGEKDSGK